MTRSFLVTGGTGFLGSALVRSLLLAGHRVRILDDNSRGNLRRLEGLADDCELIAGDIRDPSAVGQAVRGVDAVWHLAFVNGTEFFYTRPDVVLDVGVKGIVNVLDACRTHDVGELFVASSSEVYHSPPRVPTDENVPLVIPDPLNPRYSYAAGKILSEVMALNIGRRGFRRVVVFRPHNVYGPDMGWEHVVPQLVMRARALARQTEAGRPLRLPIQGTGQERRAFTYITDFTAGLMRLVDRGEHLNIYHIGSQEEVTIADLAGRVAAYFGRDVELVPGVAPAGATARRCPDIAKMKALGFVPCVSLAEGLVATARWYDENAALAPSAP